jgi:hypothetical protein
MLNNKNHSFAVALPTKNEDPNNFYKTGLVEEILKVRNQYPGFTVAGIDDPVVKRGIEHASHGNLLTIGTAKTHDVEWVERPNYAREKGYAPVLDIRKDWSKIVARLKKYAEEHHGATEVTLSGGRRAIIHRDFIKIGYKLYTYADFAAVTGLTPADIKTLYFNLK